MSKKNNAINQILAHLANAAAAAAETRGWKVSEEKNTWYKEQLVKNGMKVEAGSEQLRSDFKKVGATIISDWTSQTGAEGQAIIDAFGK